MPARRGMLRPGIMHSCPHGILHGTHFALDAPLLPFGHPFSASLLHVMDGLLPCFILRLDHSMLRCLRAAPWFTPRLPERLPAQQLRGQSQSSGCIQGGDGPAEGVWGVGWSCCFSREGGGDAWLL